MAAPLAVRALIHDGGMQVLYVDLGGDAVHEPDPALAMRTWEDSGVAIIPANVMCRCDGPKPREKFGLILESRAIAQIAARANVEVPVFDSRYKAGNHDAELRTVFDTLERELSRGGLGTSLYIDALLAQLIVCVFRAFDAPATLPVLEPIPAPAPLDERAVRVLRYIDEHLDHDLNVDDIARVVDLSTFHFSRAFKRWTGESPHRYLLRQRLVRAQRLVIDSTMPLAQIARSLGFYDQSHFGHHFKRYFGETPRQTRERKNVPAR